MSLSPDSPALARPVSNARWWVLAVGLPLVALLGWYLFPHGPRGPEPRVAAGEPSAEVRRPEKRQDDRVEAPEFEGGIAQSDNHDVVMRSELAHHRAQSSSGV